MKRALGDDIEGEYGENFLRNDDSQRNQGPEEEKKSDDTGNNQGGIKNYFKSALNKITKSEPTEDYEQLPGNNPHPAHN